MFGLKHITTKVMLGLTAANIAGGLGLIMLAGTASAADAPAAYLSVALSPARAGEIAGQGAAIPLAISALITAVFVGRLAMRGVLSMLAAGKEAGHA